jgi:hypothetical protein
MDLRRTPTVPELLSSCGKVSLATSLALREKAHYLTRMLRCGTVRSGVPELEIREEFSRTLDPDDARNDEA